jgi:hypothetical protein
MCQTTITERRDRLFKLDDLLLRKCLRLAIADQQIMDYLESEANKLTIELANHFMKGQSVSFEDILADMDVERRYRQINEIESLYTVFNYPDDPAILAAIHSARSSVSHETMSDAKYHEFLVFMSSRLIPERRESTFRKLSGVAWRIVFGTR